MSWRTASERFTRLATAMRSNRVKSSSDKRAANNRRGGDCLGACFMVCSSGLGIDMRYTFARPGSKVVDATSCRSSSYRCHTLRLLRSRSLSAT